MMRSWSRTESRQQQNKGKSPENNFLAEPDISICFASFLVDKSADYQARVTTMRNKHSTGILAKITCAPSYRSREDGDGDTPLLCLTRGWWSPQISPMEARVRHIYQQHQTSCGLASVAMLADVTYQTVLNRTDELRILKKPGYFGTNSRQLIDLLRSFDIKAVCRTDLISWLDVPQIAIVGVSPSGPHWVVAIRTENDFYIYDPGRPLPNALRRDFGRLHLLGVGIEIVSAPGLVRLPKTKLWKPSRLNANS